MSRPSITNVSQNTQSITNKAAANSNVTHPSGHTITIYADGAIWDETADKAILPQDLKRN